jgi:hypothetical protein
MIEPNPGAVSAPWNDAKSWIDDRPRAMELLREYLLRLIMRNGACLPAFRADTGKRLKTMDGTADLMWNAGDGCVLNGRLPILWSDIAPTNLHLQGA